MGSKNMTKIKLITKTIDLIYIFMIK